MGLSLAETRVHLSVDTGKTLKFYPHKDTEVTVQNPKTGDTFRMAELHFHWDEESAAGASCLTFIFLYIMMLVMGDSKVVGP